MQNGLLPVQPFSPMWGGGAEAKPSQQTGPVQLQVMGAGPRGALCTPMYDQYEDQANE